MTTHDRRTTQLALAVLISGVAVAACKSLGTPADQENADSLWQAMSGHEQWAPFEGHEGLQPGVSPHGKFVRVFVNPIGADTQEAPAYGTIIVKENYSSEDLTSLESLTIMQRSEGYDPDNDDWFWARYTPAGELTHSGKVESCSNCHFDAGGDDFVFLND